MFRRRRELDMSVRRVRNRNKFRIILFLLYVVFGIYLLNFKLPILEVPAFFSKIEDWLIAFSGALLLYASFRRLRN